MHQNVFKKLTRTKISLIEKHELKSPSQKGHAPKPKVL